MGPRRESQRRGARLADLGTLLNLGASYWLSLQVRVQKELSQWEAVARRIPDPLLRACALEKLTGERLNPEAAALFAVLAPPRRRLAVTKLIVAYQVLYDYLDGLNEKTGFHELVDGLQLHRALTDAVAPACPVSDYYLHHPEAEDGGYMRALTATCRKIVAGIPSVAGSERVLLVATERCGRAQSHNHAPGNNRSELIAWSSSQLLPRSGYHWWEVAAGGISCLGIHALLASAADPRSGPDEPDRLDAAYFPSVCALSGLLDSLADYERDADTANHSFVAHYRDSSDAAERLLTIAEEARSMIEPLRNSRRHAIILAGIVAYYLSSHATWTGFPAAAATALGSSAGPIGETMRAVLAARRRLHERQEARSSPGPPRQPRSRKARLGSTLEARKPGTASTTSAAPTIAPAVSTPPGTCGENGTGNPVTALR